MTLGPHFYWIKDVISMQEVKFTKFVNLSKLSQTCSDFINDEAAVQRWLNAQPRVTILQLGVSDIKHESNFWSLQDACQLHFNEVERCIGF